jgi:hypothetical protein
MNIYNLHSNSRLDPTVRYTTPYIIIDTNYSANANLSYTYIIIDIQ